MQEKKYGASPKNTGASIMGSIIPGSLNSGPNGIIYKKKKKN